MKRNITIALDDETARWVRLEAAKQDTSVSQYLAEILSEHRQRQEGYEAAMRRYLGRPAQPMKPARGRYPSRDALHERNRGP